MHAVILCISTLYVLFKIIEAPYGVDHELTETQKVRATVPLRGQCHNLITKVFLHEATLFFDTLG